MHTKVDFFAWDTLTPSGGPEQQAWYGFSVCVSPPQSEKPIYAARCMHVAPLQFTAPP
jgi:hypothetical protein